MSYDSSEMELTCKIGASDNDQKLVPTYQNAGWHMTKDSTIQK
jgi:hypothetical protein